MAYIDGEGIVRASKVNEIDRLRAIMRSLRTEEWLPSGTDRDTVQKFMSAPLYTVAIPLIPEVKRILKDREMSL